MLSTLAFLSLACGSFDDGLKVGERAPELRFLDRNYLERSLAEFGERRGYVLYFVTVDCPLVGRYLPRLRTIEAAYREQGVQFLAVNVGPADDVVRMVGQAVDHEIPFPFVKDERLAVARALGVDRASTVVVLDGERRLHYRGRIDAQYRVAGVRPNAGRADLREALDDLLEGRPARVAETPVDGCVITAPAAPSDEALTFARDVAPLVYEHCSVCHRDGGVAPFALVTYGQVKAHGGMIEEVVRQRRMPPWYGSPEHGSFANDRRLDERTMRTFAAWIAQGMPPGAEDDVPEPPAFPSRTWHIDEPDRILEATQEITLPANGYVPYKYVLFPHVFLQDTWVEQIEILPANPRVLHHANLAQVKIGLRFDSVEEGFITGLVPGGDPMVLDAGTAVKIRAGSVLGIQAHYVTTGKPETDRLRVGLRFPRTTVQRELRVLIVNRNRFEIPPHAEGHPVRARKTLLEDSLGIGLFSHMHLRGKDMTFEAIPPQGDPETLLVVPNYSFDWQQSYRWAPGTRRFMAGTRIAVLAHFDNSTFNPFNPDPERAVRFGLRTEDEMMYGFLFYLHEHERLGLAIDPETGRARRD